MSIQVLLYRSLSYDHNVAAELGDTDNSGCVDVDGVEGTRADVVGSVLVGGCSEIPGFHVESEESAMNVDVMLACLYVRLQMKTQPSQT